jgi:hypothetical protein
MARYLTAIFTVSFLSILYSVGVVDSKASAPLVVSNAAEGRVAERTGPEKPSYVLPKVFKHGDCSWIPAVALAAGWKSHQMPRLMHIVARESGCCPRRIGGSVVDANCNFIKMATMSHPSDSGLTQLNGVHWKPDHAQYAGLLCKRMDICTQEPLLDAFTNLKAAKLLHSVAGWQPWAVPAN